MILYLIGFCILIIVICFMYIRLRHRFWSIQPVYHYYDIYYWLFNKGIIRHELPQKNKYTNFTNIETVHFDKLRKTYINDFVSLIRLHYLRNKTTRYNPNKHNILPYFVGHTYKCFWTFYWENDMLVDNKTNKIIDSKKLVGAITSRPLNVSINNAEKDATFDVYYVDYLCVDSAFRNKNIAPQLIQTHEYNQSHLNTKICVSLFKREGSMTDIVPLTCYKTYYFRTHKWTKQPELDHSLTLLVGDVQNMYYFYNFMSDTKDKWSITICPSMSNMMELIKTKNIYILMLVHGTSIKASYIYKKTACSIYNHTNKSFDEEVLCCIASINGSLGKHEFIQGFKFCTWSLLQTHMKYKYCSIENISDNHYLISNIKERTPCIIENMTGYFFYNFAYKPFYSNKALIIN